MNLKDLGLTMRNWLVWHYTFGTNCKAKFARSKTHILYFVKDPNYFTFNADAIKIESARQRMGDKRAAAGGKIPDDVWEFPRLVGNARERTEHPCQMPESVLERIVKVATNPGDWILDPFAGSGTTLAVAKRLKRNSVGIEQSEKFRRIIAERLADQPRHDQPRKPNKPAKNAKLNKTAQTKKK